MSCLWNSELSRIYVWQGMWWYPGLWTWISFKASPFQERDHSEWRSGGPETAFNAIDHSAASHRTVCLKIKYPFSADERNGHHQSRCIIEFVLLRLVSFLGSTGQWILESVAQQMSTFKKPIGWRRDVWPVDESVCSVRLSFISPFDTRINFFLPIWHRPENAINGNFNEIRQSLFSVIISMTMERNNETNCIYSQM